MNDFLKKHNATMEIEFVGKEMPLWDNRLHNTYDCTIRTPRGEMTVHFYDNMHNTELFEKSKSEAERAKAVPTERDILSCLQLYDVGDMDDFMRDFGYEIECAKDIVRFLETYNSVVKEYNDVRRCFTEQQIEELKNSLYSF